MAIFVSERAAILILLGLILAAIILAAPDRVFGFLESLQSMQIGGA